MPVQTKQPVDRVESIVFNITPVPYYRATRKSLWDNRAKKYLAYKRAIQWTMKLEKFIPGDQLYLKFYFPIPKSWSKMKRGEAFYEPHQQKPDIDNFIKGLLDAMFENHGGDHKVHEIHATKKWSEEGYIEVTNLPPLVSIYEIKQEGKDE